MSIQGFRGNCDSQASWGCAPALPNRIQGISLEESCPLSADSEAILPNRIQVVFLEVRFPIPSRRQLKSFLIQQFFKNAGEVQGEEP